MSDEIDYLQLKRVHIGDNSINGKEPVVIESGVV